MQEEEQLAGGYGWHMLRRDEEPEHTKIVGLADAVERFGKKRSHGVDPDQGYVDQETKRYPTQGNCQVCIFLLHLSHKVTTDSSRFKFLIINDTCRFLYFSWQRWRRWKQRRCFSRKGYVFGFHASFCLPLLKHTLLCEEKLPQRPDNW